MTKGRLRNKIGLLVKAMDGKVTDHHRFLLKMHFEHLESISSQINELDEDIYRKRGAIRKGVQTYPDTSCNQWVTCASVIAEIGVDMSQFPDERHLSSWAAISPGNNESAGKTKSSRTRRGNNYLKTTLVEAAWVASRTKDTFLAGRYYNIARRRGSKRAAVAIGHQILKDVYYILSTGGPYKELGAETAQNRKSEVREHSIIRELEGMGYSVRKADASA